MRSIWKARLELKPWMHPRACYKCEKRYLVEGCDCERKRRYDQAGEVSYPRKAARAVAVTLLLLVFLAACNVGAVLGRFQDKPHNCGQVCVAYLAGVSSRDVENYLGHDHETTPAEIIGALNHYGIATAGYFTYLGGLPQAAMLLLQYPDYLHWVVWRGEVIWDPALPYTYEEPQPGTRIISYVGIED